jgi:hypothetical protein
VHGLSVEALNRVSEIHRSGFSVRGLKVAFKSPSGEIFLFILGAAQKPAF